MRKSSMLCLDANIVVRQITEPDNPLIQNLWRDWQASDVSLVASVLLRFKVTNAIHRLQRAGAFSEITAHFLLDAALAQPIVLHAETSLHKEALSFAGRFNLPAAYDAHDLALADRLDAVFWTADKRLANMVGSALPWVHPVGELADQG